MSSYDAERVCSVPCCRVQCKYFREEAPMSCGAPAHHSGDSFIPEAHCCEKYSPCMLLKEWREWQNLLVAHAAFSTEMLMALRRKVFAGHRGWDDRRNRNEWQCRLSAKIVQHANSPDEKLLVDIANYAMFLWRMGVKE